MAYRERHDARHVRNQLGHLEDHVGALSVLLGFTVDFEPETDLVDGRQLGLFDERSA